MHIAKSTSFLVESFIIGGCTSGRPLFHCLCRPSHEECCWMDLKTFCLLSWVASYGFLLLLSERNKWGISIRRWKQKSYQLEIATFFLFLPPFCFMLVHQLICQPKNCVIPRSMDPLAGFRGCHSWRRRFSLRRTENSFRMAETLLSEGFCNFYCMLVKTSSSQWTLFGNPSSFARYCGFSRSLSLVS